MKTSTIEGIVLQSQVDSFTDGWLLQIVEITKRNRLKLSGEDSLYFHYERSCAREEIPPISMRSLSRRLETLVALKHRHLLTRVRTSEGVYFEGLSLNRSGLGSENQSLHREHQLTKEGGG